MKRFRRHTLLLRPNLVLVYDELEAREPVRWDWMLHCRYNMQATGSTLTVEGKEVKVNVFGSTPMTAVVHDKPLFMPINVDGRGGKDRGTPYSIKGTHACISTIQKTAQQRVLSFVQVGEVNDIKKISEDVYVCGDWRIEAVMAPGQMANLKVTSKDGAVFFLLKDEKTGETVLTERINGKKVEQRVVDELPYHAQGIKYVSNIKK